MRLRKVLYKKYFTVFGLVILAAFASGQTAVTFSSQAKATNKSFTITSAASFFSPFADFSAAAQVQKVSKIKTASLILKPVPNLQIGFGNLSFYGAGKYAQNPVLSVPAAISGFSIGQKGFAMALSGASTSQNTPFSAAILAKYSGFTFYCGCKFLPSNIIEENEQDLDKNIFLPWQKSIFTGIGNNIKDTVHGVCPNGGNIFRLSGFDTHYFAGADYAPPKTRMLFSLQAGEFVLRGKSTTRWWLTTPYFVPQKINFAVGQFFYTGEKLRIFLNGGASTSPYTTPRFFTSSRVQLNGRKMQTECGTFLSQKDFVTTNGAFLHKTAIFYFHPQIKPAKLPNGLGKISCGATVSFGQNYSAERNAEENWTANYNFSLLYQNDYFKIKPSIKVQNPFSFQQAKNRMFCRALTFCGETQFDQNIDFTFTRNIFEKDQQFSIAAGYKFFPLNKNKTESDDQFSVTAKTYLKIGDNLSFNFSHGANFKQYNGSFYLYSAKTGANAKFSINQNAYNFAVSLGFSHNQNLQNASSSSTIFNCGVTFRIKP